MTRVIKEKDVTEMERSIGGEFPGNYRDAILKKDGGSYLVEGRQWDLYRLGELPTGSDLGNVRPSIKGATKHFADYASFPKGAIAIGDDNDWNVLVIYPGVDALYTWSFQELESQTESGCEPEFVPISIQT